MGPLRNKKPPFCPDMGLLCLQVGKHEKRKWAIQGGNGAFEEKTDKNTKKLEKNGRQKKEKITGV